jgi:hypothetical protein
MYDEAWEDKYWQISPKSVEKPPNQCLSHPAGSESQLLDISCDSAFHSLTTHRASNLLEGLGNSNSD